MKFWVFSDLHLLHHSVDLQLPAGVDAILNAGDTQDDSYITKDWGVPAFTVAGNHEFYGTCWQQRVHELRDLGIMETDIRYLGDVRIVGATLWTDYCLYGARQRELAMATARSSMNDHRAISWQKKPWRRFTPNEALSLHRLAYSFLLGVLSQPHAGPTVVVTHHAPHPKSIHPKYANNILNAAYASDLDLIERFQPDLWVHGHVHSAFDYQVGKTRIVCNPRGYPNENPNFNPQLILEV